MKNASSVVLWNCSHPSNGVLSREFVEDAGASFLHRFQWLRNEEIGELPAEWNHLVGEYAENDQAKLVHYTLGVPGFSHYRECEFSAEWYATLIRALELVGEPPSDVVQRGHQTL